jgi:hypothetical protein
VSGNGTYTAPVGYTLPTTGTVTGTYQWDSNYSGDTNNSQALDPGLVTEQTAVSPAQPAIVTTPDAKAVTLGTSSVTLTDTAMLSGGYHEIGTITFTLVAPSGSTVDTETVPVNGNGNYTTPVGYTLPITGAVTGTYQWNASYAGDTNDNRASEAGLVGERTVVSSASPSLTTTASPAPSRSAARRPDR